MPEGTEPTLHNADNKVTPLYIEIQLCEKFAINVLEYFAGKNAEWQSPEGIALKTILFAYHQLNAQEEQRIHDDMDKQTKNNDKPKTRRGR